MKGLSVVGVLFLGLIGQACEEEFPATGNSSGTGGSDDNLWSIPISEVHDGGPGKDGIPALLEPVFIEAEEADYLQDEDLVIGFVQGDEARAYPHLILDWHEIINDRVGDVNISVTYCPLTGTGIGWNREINGKVSTFGVSGLLFNSNLIPYDRLTGSNWSQIMLESVNGSLLGKRIETFPLVETTWLTWKLMYPSTKVLSKETGHSRDYGRYPYGNYRTRHDFLIFPVSHTDDRIPNKERVHGVVLSDGARVYPMSVFGNSVTVIQENILDRNIVVAGSNSGNFVVSYLTEIEEGVSLSFAAVQDQYPVIMADQEGNSWDVFGKAISGPRTGARLEHARSFMGYWFSFAAFYPELSIYTPE
jgi:hypothetical protein